MLLPALLLFGCAAVSRAHWCLMVYSLSGRSAGLVGLAVAKLLFRGRCCNNPSRYPPLSADNELECNQMQVGGGGHLQGKELRGVFVCAPHGRKYRKQGAVGRIAAWPKAECSRPPAVS